MIYKLIGWIVTKYKITKFRSKHGPYLKESLTIHEYENFEVSDEDKNVLLDINAPRFHFMQETGNSFRFILKSKLSNEKL